MYEQEGLGEHDGSGLSAGGDFKAPGRYITKPKIDGIALVGRCAAQTIPDYRQHQGAEGVINHWFVVDGQELFAHCLGDGMEARAAATGENDALP